jgi:hypothetical protein
MTNGPNSTQTAALPEYLQPYVSSLLQGAQQNFYAPYTPYSGPRIAEQSPTYMYGAEQLANNQASPYIDMAGTAAAGAYDTLTGRMNDPTWMDTAGPYQSTAWGGRAAPGDAWAGGGPNTSAWSGGAAPAGAWQGSGASAGSSWLAQNGAPSSDVWGNYNFTEPSWTDAGIANAYMNPYTQGVLDIQRREANLSADQQLQKYRDSASSRGAFGGSRSAILEGELNRNRLQNLSDIEAKGLNEAYMTGMGQFNTENAGNRALLGMGMGQFNADQGRLLNAWQAGAGQSNAEANRALDAWRANTGQFNLDANRALDAWRGDTGQFNTDQSRQLADWQARTGQFNADAARALSAWSADTGQFNADAGRALSGWQANAGQYNNEYGQAISGASAQQGLAGLMGNLAGTDFSQNRQVIQDIMNVGLTEEGRRQRELDMDYADFQEQRDYPTKQLDAYRSLIYGTPRAGDTKATNEAPPNWLTQMAGIGTLLWGGTK